MNENNQKEFDAYVASLPEKYWAKYDLAAVRFGWDAHLARIAELEGRIDDAIEYIKQLERPTRNEAGNLLL